MQQAVLPVRDGLIGGYDLTRSGCPQTPCLTARPQKHRREAPPHKAGFSCALDCGFGRAHAAQTWFSGDLAVGFWKVTVLFYFALAFGVGVGHYFIKASYDTDSVGFGLSWPWQVIKFVISVN